MIRDFYWIAWGGISLGDCLSNLQIGYMTRGDSIPEGHLLCNLRIKMAGPLLVRYDPSLRSKFDALEREPLLGELLTEECLRWISTSGKLMDSILVQIADQLSDRDKENVAALAVNAKNAFRITLGRLIFLNLAISDHIDERVLTEALGLLPDGPDSDSIESNSVLFEVATQRSNTARDYYHVLCEQYFDDLEKSQEPET